MHSLDIKAAGASRNSSCSIVTICNKTVGWDDAARAQRPAGAGATYRHHNNGVAALEDRYSSQPHSASGLPGAPVSKAKGGSSVAKAPRLWQRCYGARLLSRRHTATKILVGSTLQTRCHSFYLTVLFLRAARASVEHLLIHCWQLHRFGCHIHSNNKLACKARTPTLSKQSVAVGGRHRCALAIAFL